MNFQKYAKYYDFFYKDKNYIKEIQNIHKLVKFKKSDLILEVGCGTGKHTEIISPYVFSIDAIDKSKKMIQEAKKNISIKNKKKIKLLSLDLLNLNENKKYDKIIMLFHVFSYFINEKYLRKVFIKLNNILKKNGKLIFDYWNQDHIDNYGLKNSFKEVIYKDFMVQRVGKVKKISKTKYSVNYKFNILKNNNIEKSFSETHHMRAFNVKLITNYFENNFELKKIISLNSGKKLRNKDFSALMILEKK